MKVSSSIEMLEPKNYEKADLCIYQRLVRKLIYLLCGTRPDIAFVVGQLSRHNADPRNGHLQAAKREVKELKGTVEMRLTFGQERKRSPKDSLLYRLIDFANSNFVGDPEDQKSVIDYYFFLNGVVVS